jgi:hypothetical protein
MITTRLLVVNFARDALTLEAPCVRVPGHSLLVFGLTETLEEPHARAVGVEGVYIVDHDRLIAVAKELDVHAEGGGVALDPAALAAEHRADGAAFRQAARADQDEEMKVPLGKGAEILLQPLIGRDPERLPRRLTAWSLHMRNNYSLAGRGPKACQAAAKSLIRWIPIHNTCGPGGPSLVRPR